MASPSLKSLRLAILALLISSKTLFLSAQYSTLSIATDKQALLSFKSLVNTDQSPNPLSTWDQSWSPCNWTGVSCNKNGDRVVAIDLSGQGLKGSISPHISNLSFLESLQLQKNQLMGPFPDQVANLFRLRLLNMSFNSIGGALPQKTSTWVELRSLDLMDNEISGTIPEDITRLKNLQVLNLAHNNLSGPIPISIGNISSLIHLNLGTNILTGTIPGDLARLRYLETIDLTINNLWGTVPSAIYNMSSLVNLALASNDLWGTFPSDIETTLPNLLVFNFCFNKFTGPIPGSLHNLTKIRIIRMAHNLLTGAVPPGLEKLSDLEMYNIGFNNIVSTGYNGLQFLSSLTNSTRLHFLAIDGNLLEGVIPESIGNLSKVLKSLYMGENRIYGTIPSTVGHLSGLSLLNLGSNSLSGEIPHEIGQLQNLQELNLAGNNLQGAIPPSLGDLRGLNEINLSRNVLKGPVPTQFGHLQRLLSMDLSNNKLDGTIPREILTLPSLSNYLNLSNNLLTGALPWEIGELKSVVTIELSHNALSGPIPESIGQCTSLERLLLANNIFSGQIPNAIETMKALETLDISSNKLSGGVPSGLQKLKALQFLNLSFNDLEGQVPVGGIFSNSSRISLQGNPKLCFYLRCGKSDDRRERVILLSISIAGSIVLMLCFAISLQFYLRKKKSKAISSFESFERQHQFISYKELCQATDDFNETNLIGSGSFGSVYKGYIHEQKPAAIKVLNVNVRGSWKSFQAECTALKNLRHRNLVRLITTCSSMDFKNSEFLALVYEYVSNGNLEEWVVGRRRRENGEGLNIIERVNVAVDVACVVDYLHNGCCAQVVHCDIKPSNILLDDDFNAKVGDFGLAKLLVSNSDQTSLTSGLKGSIGYIPPGSGFPFFFIP